MSLGLFWWAVTETRRDRFAIAFSQAQPARLVTTGPYQLVRHPYYLSYLLAWVAGALSAQALELCATVLVMALFYRRAISDEEAGIMSGPLSAEYAIYRSKRPPSFRGSFQTLVDRVLQFLRRKGLAQHGYVTRINLRVARLQQYCDLRVVQLKPARQLHAIGFTRHAHVAQYEIHHQPVAEHRFGFVARIGSSAPPL